MTPTTIRIDGEVLEVDHQGREVSVIARGPLGGQRWGALTRPAAARQLARALDKHADAAEATP